MAGRKRKPMGVQEQARRVHRSNAEKAARRQSETAFSGDSSNMAPPSYLTTKEQRARHREVVALLQGANEALCTDLDVDAVARFVLEEEEYVASVRQLRAARRAKRSVPDVERAQRLKNNAFKCVDSAAKAIGLTVDSRLRFDLKKPEEKPQNKFADLDD